MCNSWVRLSSWVPTCLYCIIEVLYLIVNMKVSIFVWKVVFLMCVVSFHWYGRRLTPFSNRADFYYKPPPMLYIKYENILIVFFHNSNNFSCVPPFVRIIIVCCSFANAASFVMWFSVSHYEYVSGILTACFLPHCAVDLAVRGHVEVWHIRD